MEYTCVVFPAAKKKEKLVAAADDGEGPLVSGCNLISCLLSSLSLSRWIAGVQNVVMNR